MLILMLYFINGNPSTIKHDFRYRKINYLEKNNFVPSLDCGGYLFGPCFCYALLTQCPFQFYNHLDKEGRELVALLLLSF